MQKIGFIGIGVMGGPIVGHLLQAGFEVYGFSRTQAKVARQIKQGLKWCDSIETVVTNADIIFTMVGFPTDVEEIYLGESGILEYARPNQILIDLTTSQPRLAKKIAKEAAVQHIQTLDAPVTGGDLGAINGTLAMMVGGDQETFATIEPILAVFTSTIRYFGESGNGQHAKMANQTAIAANLVGMAESLAYAVATGLDTTAILEIMGSGSAASWQLINNGPKALADDMSPGFYIKHFVKDMRIALEEAKLTGLELPGLEQTEALFTQLLDQHDGDLGTQAIYKLYQQ